MKSFNYIVISKGGVVTYGRERVLGMTNSVTSFYVSLSTEMAPSCKIVVYHTTPDGEIVADSLTLPIKGISREELTLWINKKQDRTGNLIELVPSLGLGSIIGLSAHDTDTIDVQGFNEITPASASLELYRNVRGRHKKFIWKNTAGRNERVEYFITPNAARETESTFAFADMVVFTNMNMSQTANACAQRRFPNGTTIGRWVKSFY